MPAAMNRQVLLAHRPEGEPRESDFTLVEVPIPEPGPGQIDVYFDNVAGPVLAAVLRHINLGARIPLVGLISQYNAPAPPPGPNLMPLLVKRALIQGFLVGDHPHRRDAFL